MTLRIGTWNLEHAHARRHDAARLDVLGHAAADIWVLTETNDRVALEGYQAASTAPRPASWPGGRWVTIWSRWDIVETLQVADESRSVAARVAAPAGELVVYGTVLPWHTDVGEPPRDPKPRNWSEQHRTIPIQGQDWVRLRREHSKAHLVVAGDLNMNLGGPQYYGTAEGRGLLELAMAAAGLACATHFDRVPAGLLRHGAIDHVLLPLEMAERSRVAGAWEGVVDGQRLSDHSGLVVEAKA